MHAIYMSNQTIRMAELCPFPRYSFQQRCYYVNNLVKYLNLHHFNNFFFTDYILCVRYIVNKMKLLALEEIKFYRSDRQ